MKKMNQITTKAIKQNGGHMYGKKNPTLSPRLTQGPVVRTGPNFGSNRTRREDGGWRRKRNDAGVKRK